MNIISKKEQSYQWLCDWNCEYNGTFGVMGMLVCEGLEGFGGFRGYGNQWNCGTVGLVRIVYSHLNKVLCNIRMWY